jgi:predicted lysophospholipase L1 biosynthesis ABC-type transport system permease subunit
MGRIRCAASLAAPDYFFVNIWSVQMRAMKHGKKRSSPVGGLIAGFLLLGAVGLGLVTGRMPLAGASNQGIELERWPIIFWTYAAILGALGIAVLAWSIWAFAKDRRSG